MAQIVVVVVVVVVVAAVAAASAVKLSYNENRVLFTVIPTWYMPAGQYSISQTEFSQ